MTDRTCIEPGCDRPGRGPRCTMHYQRFRAAGGQSPPRGTKRPCDAPGCDRTVQPGGGLGYCSVHYQRLKRHGTVDASRPPRPHQPRPDHCTIGTCSNPVVARSLCETHYRRWRRSNEDQGNHRSLAAESSGDPLYTKRAAWQATYDAKGGFKVCSLCDQRKPVDQFSVSRAMRDGLQQRCKPCHQRRTAETRDPERVKSYRKARYQQNADAFRQYSRDYRAANLERMRASGRLYHEKNRDRRRLYDQTRREARAEQCKAWRTPERSRAFVAHRRALKLAAPQGDPKLRAEYVQIIMRDPCVYCGAPAEAEDHIQPLTKGGADAWDNLAPACTSCNCRKNSRELLEFLLMVRG